MAKLVAFNLISLDGFFEAEDQTIDWFNVDEEFNEFALNQLKTVEAILYGRKTYEGMFEYWTSEMAMQSDPEMSTLMNETKKVVFSKTLTSLNWKNSELISNDLPLKIAKLKKSHSKDLIVFGSGNLISSLINLQLIEEIRLMIVPVLLGKGTPMFNDLISTNSLALKEKKEFKSGNLLLTYQMINK